MGDLRGSVRALTESLCAHFVSHARGAGREINKSQ